MASKINHKSLWFYLLITFGLTGLIVTLMAQMQLRTVAGVLSGQLMLLGLMFVPALATFITRQFITREGWASAGWKWGSFKNYLSAWLLIPFIFFAIFVFTAILGSQPDWSLSQFVARYNLSLPLPGPYIAGTIFLVTLFLSPWVNSLAALGEEIGWRGHLLPQLLPLGEKKALVLSSFIWGLWHAPFVFFLGFGNYSNVYLGMIFFTVMITFLGTYIGYLRLHSGSTLLAAWAHGLFNSQSYGIWPMIFPVFNTLVGGITGVVGIMVMWLLSWYSFRLLDQRNQIN